MRDEISDIQRLRDFQDLFDKIKKEIKKVIIGQDRVVDLLLISLFSDGHSIIMGVPGLAKTLLISTAAKALSLTFSRIQFTPDLMPSDIIGMEMLQEERETGRRVSIFVKGPVFTNILLADEINRATPKTQSALLQSMQEYAVTIGGKTYNIERPFIVFATQNPIEQEGTYPLPEAQLDRFLMMIKVNYPNYKDEIEIVKNIDILHTPQISPIISREELLSFREYIMRVPVAEHLYKYAVEIGRLTRPSKENPIKEVNEFVRWGAGPRALKHLMLASRTNSVLNKRSAMEIEDIEDMLPNILSHRIILNFKAVSSKITAEDILSIIIKQARKNI